MITPFGSQAARLAGDGRFFEERHATARIALRSWGEVADWFLDEHLSRAIEAIAETFPDARVPAGCIRGGKSRPDRLYVRIYLTRQLTKMPPRFMAKELGLTPSFLKFATDRGRQLMERAKQDGRLDPFLG